MASGVSVSGRGHGVDDALKRASTSKTVEGLIFSVSPIVLLDSSVEFELQDFKTCFHSAPHSAPGFLLFSYYGLHRQRDSAVETMQKVLIPGVIGRVRIADRKMRNSDRPPCESVID